VAQLRRYRTVLIGGVVVGAGALVVTQPGLASASVDLGSRSAIVANAPDTYNFSTTNQGWSVVSLRSQAGSNYNLKVSDGSHWVASQTGITDFALLNSNPGAHPLDDYTADVIRRSGTGSYSIRFNVSSRVLRTPTNAAPSAATAIRTTSTSPVTIVRWDLEPGKGVRVQFPPHTAVYSLNGNPGGKTMIRRNEAIASNISAGGALQGAWTIGDAETGGCVAMTNPVFDESFVPILVLIDDDPMGSAKTFYPYAYDREVDPEEC
jgi:hypothetical protein